MVPQAAVASGPWHWPQWVALRIALPIWIVYASRTAKGTKAPFFWALHAAFADGYLVRAARTGCSPRWSVRHSCWALGVCSATRDCCSIRSQPDPADMDQIISTVKKMSQHYKHLKNERCLFLNVPPHDSSKVVIRRLLAW